MKKNLITKDKSFDSLLMFMPKFYDMKTKDNKMPLLQYIIESIMKNVDSNLFNFMEYFESFTKMDLKL